ncbi:MAG TPA: DUF418 domain-containing protein [Steroidobacteraceae bacterium]|nr:DUF418 domain-containing protein [Steroidobacteraceae bacterium]
MTLIDALRGAALFGVLLVNIMWFAGMGHAVPDGVLAGLSTAPLDTLVEDLIDLLVSAKAIGVFSFLFGVGFAMQIESISRCDPAPQRRYSRRLVGLLVLGLVHWLAIWSGEILHVYAAAGFVLLGLRRLRTRTLVAAGLVLAVFARPIAGHLYVLAGGDGSMVMPSANDFALRFDVFTQGSFAQAVGLQLREDVTWQLISGSTLADLLHALGRFMVGIAVARGGYLRQPGGYLHRAAWIAALALPAGFVLEHDWVFGAWMLAHGWVTQPLALQIFRHACNSLGVVCMTAGYVTLFMLGWQVELFRRMFAWLVPTGRMALTNYLSQTAICYLLFFGFGLALMGRVGTTVCLAISVAVYLLQCLVSHWWLAHFRFGPMEWLWRWWTYGSRPRLLRSA